MVFKSAVSDSDPDLDPSSTIYYVITGKLTSLCLNFTVCKVDMITMPMSQSHYKD